MIAKQLFPDLLREALSLGRRVRFHAMGRSMNPTIVDGDAIRLASVIPAAIEVGDVVLFQLPRGLVAHRVERIEVRQDDALEFLVKGDAAESTGEWATAHEVVARVEAVERDGQLISLGGIGERWRHSLWELCAGVVQRVRRMR